MSNKQIYGLIGVGLLLIACFLPLAKLNDFIISIFPVWGNSSYQADIWNWRDISFFAFTMLLLIILSFVFAFRKIYNGLLITSLIVIFVTIIIFVTVLQVQSKASAYSNISFHLSWGWLSLLPGALLLLGAGLKKNHQS